MKRLTVIIPGYRNPDAWWHRCVTSVLRAIGQEDEIICIDDGSPERPSLEDVAKCDARVRIIFQDTNGGLSVARNTALDVAQGRYVTFVDSDDEVMPDVYEKTLAKMQETKSSIGIFGVKVIWPDDGLMKVDLPDEKSYGALTPQDILGLSKSCLLNYAWNKIYDVQHITALSSAWSFRFDPDGMPAEDIIFNMRCTMADATWCSIAYAGYVYYRTQDTLLSRYKPTVNRGYALANQVWREYKDRVYGAREVLGDLGEFSEHSLALARWKNMWLPGSPFGLIARWKYLRAHQVELTMRPAMFYLRTMLFMFLRRHFYLRPIRRWNTRRAYPQAQEWIDRKI